MTFDTRPYNEFYLVEDDDSIVNETNANTNMGGHILNLAEGEDEDHALLLFDARRGGLRRFPSSLDASTRSWSDDSSAATSNSFLWNDSSSFYNASFPAIIGEESFGPMTMVPIHPITANNNNNNSHGNNNNNNNIRRRRMTLERIREMQGVDDEEDSAAADSYLFGGQDSFLMNRQRVPGRQEVITADDGSLMFPGDDSFERNRQRIPLSSRHRATASSNRRNRLQQQQEGDEDDNNEDHEDDDDSDAETITSHASSSIMVDLSFRGGGGFDSSLRGGGTIDGSFRGIDGSFRGGLLGLASSADGSIRGNNNIDGSFRDGSFREQLDSSLRVDDLQSPARRPRNQQRPRSLFGGSSSTMSLRVEDLQPTPRQQQLRNPRSSFGGSSSITGLNSNELQQTNRPSLGNTGQFLSQRGAMAMALLEQEDSFRQHRNRITPYTRRRNIRRSITRHSINSLEQDHVVPTVDDDEEEESTTTTVATSAVMATLDLEDSLRHSRNRLTPNSGGGGARSSTSTSSSATSSIMATLDLEDSLRHSRNRLAPYSRGGATGSATTTTSSSTTASSSLGATVDL